LPDSVHQPERERKAVAAMTGFRKSQSIFRGRLQFLPGHPCGPRCPRVSGAECSARAVLVGLEDSRSGFRPQCRAPPNSPRSGSIARHLKRIRRSTHISAHHSMRPEPLFGQGRDARVLLYRHRDPYFAHIPTGGPRRMRLGDYRRTCSMLKPLLPQRCRARTHGGYPCSKHAVPGKRVCRWHGGLSPGRQGPRDAEHMRKVRAGSQRWYAERRARKAAGLPVRRMGRIPGRRKWEPIEISRARASVEDQIRALVMDQMKG